MPSTFTRRDEAPRGLELPLVLHASMHRETVESDLRGYFDGVRGSVEALRSRGYAAAAAELSAMCAAAVGRGGA